MTKREKILKLRKDGCTFREICEKLNISSTSVVHHHLKNAPFDLVTRKHLKEAVIHYKKLAEKYEKQLQLINEISNA